MKLGKILILGGTWLLAAASANAAVDMAKGTELAQKNNCLSCHGIDKKIIGPAYQDVAKKYRGDKDAMAKLVKKVKEGGTGVWGQIPMPPNAPKVSDADVATLVEWVLAH